MMAPQVSPPPVEAERQLQHLEERVVWHWGLTLLAETAGLVLALLVFGRFLDQWLPVGSVTAAVAVIGLATALLLPPARHRRWAYQLRERDLYVRRGVLSHAISVIPLARIQHVDTRQDLVERWLGLGRVVVYTAGIRGAELTIPGIAADEAEALRDRLAALSGVEHAV